MTSTNALSSTVVLFHCSVYGLCREAAALAATLKAQKRREIEDAALAAAMADDIRRMEEEVERSKKDMDERLRAAEEQKRSQEEQTKLNKKAKKK